MARFLNFLRDRRIKFGGNAWLEQFRPRNSVETQRRAVNYVAISQADACEERRRIFLKEESEWLIKLRTELFPLPIGVASQGYLFLAKRERPVSILGSKLISPGDVQCGSDEIHQFRW